MGASPMLLLVTWTVRTSSVSSSMPMCILRHMRRLEPPCLPLTYGKWGKYFVSPAMHRRHHSSEAKAFDKNFGEFFCIFDKAFGT